MKSPLKRLTILAAASLILGITACDKENDQQIVADKSQDAPTPDAQVVETLPFTPVELAAIEKDGHEFKFIDAGDEEIVVLEHLTSKSTSADGRGLLAQYEESSAFDIFLKVTDQNVAVPEKIAKTAKPGELQSVNRKIDATNSYLRIGSPEFVSTERACYDVGSAKFRKVYCYAPVSSTPNNIEFCDNGLWYSLTRQSYFDGWRKTDDVKTWTNVKCGLTKVAFYKWYNSRWNKYYEVEFTNGIWYANTSSSSDYYRRVTRTRPNSSGSFRAFTRFINQ